MPNYDLYVSKHVAVYTGKYLYTEGQLRSLKLFYCFHSEPLKHHFRLTANSKFSVYRTTNAQFTGCKVHLFPCRGSIAVYSKIYKNKVTNTVRGHYWVSGLFEFLRGSYYSRSVLLCVCRHIKTEQPLRHFHEILYWKILEKYRAFLLLCTSYNFNYFT